MRKVVFMSVVAASALALSACGADENVAGGEATAPTEAEAVEADAVAPTEGDLVVATPTTEEL
jgi:hypothetical protein